MKPADPWDPRVFNYIARKQYFAKIRKSFTLLIKMIKNEVPDELQSSREACQEPSGHPGSDFGVQKVLDQL